MDIELNLKITTVRMNKLLKFKINYYIMKEAEIPCDTIQLIRNIIENTYD